MQDLISVILCMFNSEKYLEEAIDSVLSQTNQNFQLIVIDDGSTDQSAAIVKQYSQIKYFYHPNRGLMTSINRALEHGTGHYYAYIDADDLWHKDKLDHQLALLKSNPSTQMVFSHLQEFYCATLSDTLKQEIKCKQTPVPGMHFGASLIRRTAINSVGKFKPEIRAGGFIDWFMRAQELNTPYLIHPEIHYYRRIHEHNYGRTHKATYTDYLKIIRAGLRRRCNSS